MSSSLGPHFSLGIIQFAHFIIESLSALHDSFKVNHIVEVAFHARNPGNNCPDLFIAENTADTATTGLFQADQFSAAVIKTEIQHANQRIIGCSSGGDNSDIFLVFFIIGINLRQVFRKEMGIYMFNINLTQGHLMIDPVDKHNYIFLCFSLYFNGIKTGKFQERTEESTNIAVNRNICLG